MISDTLAASTVASTAPTTTKSDTLKGLTSDFETFLKMLTVQARYQDPLNPIDSTEYAAQLAQFSMVEQQVHTNETLTSMLSQQGVGNAASLAPWVGMEARAVTEMPFDGTPIVVAPEPLETADRAVLVVRDENGKDVQRLSILVDTEPLEWEGLDDEGVPLPGGKYHFEVESYENGKLVQTDPVPVYGRVSEAQIDDGEVVLIFDGGQRVKASDVTALRAPV